MKTGLSTAIMATLHCLTGCAIGEVLGMVIGSIFGLHGLVTIVLSVGLAFVFGYALSMLPLLRHGLPLKKALGVAFAADTVSITSMEVMDNLIVVIIPGALGASLLTWLFWGSLALSLVVAFIVTVPVNYWLIKNGKGHAVTHQYHHSHH